MAKMGCHVYRARLAASRNIRVKMKKRGTEPGSNLAFNVNPAEGFGSCGLEVTLGFAHLEVDDGVTLL